MLHAERPDSRRYIARLGKGSISVYELPDMGLLDKKSLKLEGVHRVCLVALAAHPVRLPDRAGRRQPARQDLPHRLPRQGGAAPEEPVPLSQVSGCLMLVGMAQKTCLHQDCPCLQMSAPTG